MRSVPTQARPQAGLRSLRGPPPQGAPGSPRRRVAASRPAPGSWSPSRARRRSTRCKVPSGPGPRPRSARAASTLTPAHRCATRRRTCVPPGSSRLRRLASRRHSARGGSGATPAPRPPPLPSPPFRPQGRSGPASAIPPGQLPHHRFLPVAKPQAVPRSGRPLRQRSAPACRRAGASGPTRASPLPPPPVGPVFRQGNMPCAIGPQAASARARLLQGRAVQKPDTRVPYSARWRPCRLLPLPRRGTCRTIGSCLCRYPPAADRPPVYSGHLRPGRRSPRRAAGAPAAIRLLPLRIRAGRPRFPANGHPVRARIPAASTRSVPCQDVPRNPVPPFVAPSAG